MKEIFSGLRGERLGHSLLYDLGVDLQLAIASVLLGNEFVTHFVHRSEVNGFGRFQFKFPP
jgi:hypothetical protein